jgi:hypothetical protein
MKAWMSVSDRGGVRGKMAAMNLRRGGVTRVAIGGAVISDRIAPWRLIFDVREGGGGMDRVWEGRRGG